MRGIYSVDTSDEDYNDIIKNARILFENGTFKAFEAKTKFSCIAEADESARQESNQRKQGFMKVALKEEERINSIVYNMFPRQLKPRRPKATLRENRNQTRSEALVFASGDRGHCRKETLTQITQRVTIGQTWIEISARVRSDEKISSKHFTFVAKGESKRMLSCLAT